MGTPLVATHANRAKTGPNSVSSASPGEERTHARRLELPRSETPSHRIAQQVGLAAVQG